MGWSLPLMCAVFIPYALFGRYLPSFLSHRGFAYDQVVDQLYLGTEGIYGVPTFVSATYIFLFILFGAFLERAGMIQLFNDIALGLVGHQKGGPAKVAVISSGLMGTINGSAIANVLTTGQFTIPLMIRFGYSRAFAGAVEATASMGGQIMPPVMGPSPSSWRRRSVFPIGDRPRGSHSGPSLLRLGVLDGASRGGSPQPRRHPEGTMSERLARGIGQWHLLLPLITRPAAVQRLHALFAGTIGLAMTALLILGNTVTLAISQPRSVSLSGSGSDRPRAAQPGDRPAHRDDGLDPGGGAGSRRLFLHDGRTDLRRLLGAMADAAKAALGVGIACALVGTLIGVCTLTGLASDLARMVLAPGDSNMLLALIRTMLACLVLGTGLPTIPTYIITSAMAAPALLQFGVPLIVSHMFCFYFGIMADLTPPVALAALAAQAIANASHMKIGFIATRIALARYACPGHGEWHARRPGC